MNTEKLKEYAILATLSNFNITKDDVDLVGIKIFVNREFETAETLAKAETEGAYDFLFTHSKFIKGLCENVQEKVREMVGEEILVQPKDIILYGTRMYVEDLDELKDVSLID